VAVPGMPITNISSVAATTISLSWTSAGSVVDSYEVLWERDTSRECTDVDVGNATITDGSTSYNITELEEHSSYTITVTATNAAGSAVSNPVTGMTGEAGEGLTYKILMGKWVKSFLILQFHLPLPLLSIYLM